MQFVRAGLASWVRLAVERTAGEMASAARIHGVANDRMHTAEVLALLQGRREHLLEQLTRALARQLDAATEPAPATTPAEAPGRLTLTLIDEAQIDEEIEVARIVQAIESGAEWELLQLKGLASGLRGLGAIDAAAMPLAPLAIAAGLRQGLADLGLEPGARLLLLRQLGQALGRELKQIYATLSRMILGWGVEPAPYRIAQTPATATAATAAPSNAIAPEGGAAAPPSTSSALQNLVRRARATLTLDDAPSEASSGDDTAAPTLRLLADPLPAERVRAALDPAAAVQLMERLFAQIGQHVATSPAALELLNGLQEPSRTLAARDTDIWTNPAHPWWRLLDRLIAVGSVHDAADEGRLHSISGSLARVSERLRQGSALDAAACQAAARELEDLSQRCAQERTSEMGEQIGQMQRQVDRDEVELELRNQIVQQLRSTPVCLRLRRFLVGPWTQVMTAATLRDGLNSGAMVGLALVVDDLLRATARPGRAVSLAQQRVLLRQVGDALAASGLRAGHIEAEMSDLKSLLRDPPPLHEESGEGGDEDTAHTKPTAVIAHEHAHAQLGLQGGLPTVSIGMGPAVDTTLEVATQQDWLDALTPGTYCRLFLLGRWMTAQLTWASSSHNLFLFSSRHGGRTHSLTRRMLGKLRNAGLATSIDDGCLLAQAMQTVADSDFAPA